MNKRNILFTLQTGLIILLNGCTDTSLAQNKVIVPKIGTLVMLIMQAIVRHKSRLKALVFI